MKRKLFDDVEFANAADFDEIGEIALAGLEAVTGDVGGWPAHWAGFTVTKKNNQEITVSTGRLYEGSLGYQNEAAFDYNVFSLIPIGSTDEKWIAIILRGSERTVSASALIDTTPDAETQTPVQTDIPKTFERFIDLVTQAGPAGPPPQAYPQVAAVDCAIAMVRLTVNGVEEVVPVNDDRVKTVHEIEGRLVVVEAKIDEIFERINSIETDVANLGAAVKDIPRPEIVRQMQRQISENAIAARVDPNAVAFRYDPGLFYEPTGSSAGWDITHPDAQFRVKQGIRFNWAAYRDARMEVQNEDDPNIRIGARRRTVPAYDEVIRISHDVPTEARALNQLASSVQTMVKKEIAREEIIYGPVKKYCMNAAQFANVVRGLEVGETFFINQDITAQNNKRIEAGKYQLVTSDGETSGNHKDKWRYIRQVIRRSWTEYYWDAEIEDITVTGSTHSQTFLCSQPFVMTGVDINLASVGADGVLHVLVAECGFNGTPDKSAILAQGSLDPADMVTGWNTIPIDLTTLKTGKRYALIFVTTGNHKAWVSKAGEYAGGTMFVDTDGAFQQGDLLTDINFRVRGARFMNVRTTIPFDPLTLENGMTDIRILAKTIVPDGCALEWELKPQTASGWNTLEEADRGAHPLTNLPPLTQVRLVMVGTKDLQPLIVLDSTLRGETGRHANTMVAVSEEIDFGLTSSEIVCEYRIDGWIDAEHTFNPTLIVGGVTIQATTESAPEILPTEGLAGERIKIIAVFQLAGPTQTCHLRPEMTAANVVEVPFIEDVSIHAL